MFCCLFFEIWYHVAQTGTETLIFLLLLPTCWGYRLVPTRLAFISFLSDFLGSVTHLVQAKAGQAQWSHAVPRTLQSRTLPSSLQGLLLNNLADIRSHSSSELAFDLWSVSENKESPLGLCLGWPSLFHWYD